MRKLIVMMLSILLICSLGVTAFAAGQTLTMTDHAVQAGDTVYITVALQDAVWGNSVGITYSYDDEILTPLPNSNSWFTSGALSDFNRKNAGVWAGNSTVNLKGDLCVLAFKVAPDAEFTESSVSCTVIVKNDAAEVGTYSADAEITKVCNHSYSQWTDAGTVGHTRKCSLCKATETGSHKWDDGVLAADPDGSDKNVMLYTCSVCAGTKHIDVPGSQRPTETTPTTPTTPVPTETRPKETYPTLPTVPTETHTAPTLPTIPSPTEPGHTTQTPTKPADTTNPTLPTNQFTPTMPTNPADANKDQSTTQTPDKNNNQNVGTSGQNSGSQPVVVVGGTEGEHDDHDHSDEPAIHVTPTNVATEPVEHDHDHEHEITEELITQAAQESGNPTVTAFVVAAAAAVLIGVSLWIIKRKKR